MEFRTSSTYRLQRPFLKKILYAAFFPIHIYKQLLTDDQAHMIVERVQSSTWNSLEKLHVNKIHWRCLRVRCICLRVYLSKTDSNHIRCKKTLANVFFNLMHENTIEILRSDHGSQLGFLIQFETHEATCARMLQQSVQGCFLATTVAMVFASLPLMIIRKT